MADIPNNEPVQILVEDNPGDARLAFEALKDSKVNNDLHHVKDGVEAMRFLRQQAECTDVPLPDLVLLDLNLPRKDGHDVLKGMRDDAELSLIPVVVLTTSAAERDLLNSYGLHANAYIVKPIGLNQSVEGVQAIEEFWLSIVNLPRAGDRRDLA